ncbi:MAG: bifunctional GNAT family N-acetyltransferase/carbon-nitrogen hydrolase family protein [Myxococcales bacterium]|nr:bifunctional GNAT family N-acetyltransferase/carbon-nitrogen hydrolase family protein [Myxococcales bacterium]
MAAAKSQGGSRGDGNGDLVLRNATRADVQAIADLNAIAYPLMAEKDVIWSPRHIESHLRVFPEGQFVVEEHGQIVGVASSLIVNFGRDAYRAHTWYGITDNGMFYNHDPYGDTLYGADINVHPEHRRRGIGAMLYDGRFDLCRRLNLRRIVLGGRLYDYAEHADEMTAEEYARRVDGNELRDTVLSFQLAHGFTLKRVMPNYLDDPRSLNHATFLEWLNPGHEPRSHKARAVRISSVQYKMRKISNFDGFARQIRYFVDVASGYGSDFVLFPELLTAQLMSFIRVKTPREAIRRVTEYGKSVDDLFTGLAAEFQIAIIGGTHPRRHGERVENVASLYLPDGSVHRQPKLHITPAERRWWGIEGGSTLQVFDTPKARVGILVCYDVEFPEAARFLSDAGAEIIFVPFCTDDRQAYLRVRYCAQARAVENQVYVAMAGTTGNLPDVENMDIQYAQSAVLSPSDFPFARDGVLVEASPDVETVITTDVDFEALEEAILDGSVRPRRDRRPDLFSFTTSLPLGDPRSLEESEEPPLTDRRLRLGR